MLSKQNLNESTLRLINIPNLNFCLSSNKTQDQLVQHRCLQIMLHKTQHKCTQKGLNCSYNDQLCTQSFKLWLTIINCSQTHSACRKCKFKLNKSIKMPSQQICSTFTQTFLLACNVHHKGLQRESASHNKTLKVYALPM